MNDIGNATDPFRRAVEAAPNGMILVGASGTILLVNRAAEEIFGYDRSELLGQSVDILLPDALRHRHAQTRLQYRDNPQPRRMGNGRDLVAVRKDGRVVTVEVGLGPMETEDGMAVLACLVDCSD